MGDSRVLAGRRDTRQARLRRYYGRDAARGEGMAERERRERERGGIRTLEGLLTLTPLFAVFVFHH